MSEGKNATMHIRVNKEVREEAEQILKSLGTNLSAVFELMLRQIILTRGIPFSVVLPEVLKAEEPIQTMLESPREEVSTDMNVGTLYEEVVDTSDIDGINAFYEKISSEDDLRMKETGIVTGFDFSEMFSE